MMTIAELFHLDDTIAAPLFGGKTYPWEVLGELSRSPPFPGSLIV